MKIKLIPNPLKRGNVLITCPKCKNQIPVPVIGWSAHLCVLCQQIIPHPGSVTTGYSAHGRKSKNVTLRLPVDLVAELDKLAEEHQTSRGGMARFILQLFADAASER